MKFLRNLRHPRPDISKRVVPDRSGWEVMALRDHFGHEISAHLYFYAEKLVLAAPFTGTPGNLFVERHDPVVEREPVADERLGYMALEALLRFSSEHAPNQRDAKLSDWRTFKASGANSVSSFERGSVRVTLATFYGSLRIEAQLHLPADSSFGVHTWTSASVEHAELGALLRKLVVGAHAIREAGVV